MADTKVRNVFPGPCMWGGAAHRQKMPVDVPGGPRRGEVANVMAYRSRTGATKVTVTWPVEGQVNLSKFDFDYSSPRAALDAGWELGEKYEEDARYMEKMDRFYG